MNIPTLSDAQVEGLVRDIETRGYASIDNFIRPDTLREMRSFVARAVSGSNGEYAGVTGPEGVRGTAFAELGENPVFKSLIERIFHRGTGLPPPEQDFYQVVRCLTDQSARQHSYLFHYDSYIVTALIAVENLWTGSAAICS